MKKIMIVDDHTIFRQCISARIRSDSDHEIIGETGSGMASIKLAEELKPDLIIMDISLPDINGIEALRRIRKKGIDSKIILLSMYRYPEILDQLDLLDVSAYLLKEDTFEDLIYAIQAVLDGKRYISSSLMAEKASYSETTEKTKKMNNHILSPREREITLLIAEGLTSKEIADKLCISQKTVETHRARIMKKLGVRNMAELIKQAIKIGLLNP